MSTDLLGHNIPDDLPANKQLTDVSELAGHTIKAAIDAPGGRYDCDLVIVTETGCWLAIQAEKDGCCSDDGAVLEVIGARHYHAKYLLSDFASAIMLKTHGVINQGEFELLRSIEVEREEKQNAERATRLRAQLAAIEAKPATGAAA